MKTGNNRYLKQMNQAQVLDLIRTGQARSRKALADATGLSATATGAIVKSLLADGYVLEVGEGESSGGRKPVILKLRPRTHYSIGFDIDRHFIHAVALDITGESRYTRKERLAEVPDAERIAGLVSDWTDSAMGELRIGPEHLLGIGISVPGLVDRRTHEIVLAPNLGWRGVQLKEMIESRVDTTVDVENESMCSATCEHWIGGCRDVGDFICVNVDSGIGAGIYIGGRLYRGVSGSAGEVGHVVVDEAGPKCSCGNRGCLETLASVDGMLARYGTAGIDFDGFLDRLRAGEPAAQVVAENAARSLGRATGMLVNALNPARVILGKRFPEMGAQALEWVREESTRTALAAPASEACILPSRFGGDSSAIGAAIFPIRRLFGQ